LGLIASDFDIGIGTPEYRGSKQAWPSFFINYYSILLLEVEINSNM